jgi:CBS domain-containing protein
MKVKDLMTANPQVCSPDTTVAEAAHLMWDTDCGILPVVDDGELIGVVTDRDLFIALATRNARAAHLRIGAVAQSPVVSCAPEDDVRDALALMKQARIHRVPVVGSGITVLGVLSLNDIVLAAGDGADIHADAIVDTLQAICAHHQPLAHVVAA